jgi:hypothetical protein
MVAGAIAVSWAKASAGKAKNKMGFKNFMGITPFVCGRKTALDGA